MVAGLNQLDGSNGFRVDGIDKWDRTGFAVAGAGDVNGDGLDDLMLGGFGVEQRTGATYVIFGTRAGFPASFDLSSLDGSNGFRLIGVNPREASGVSIEGAGDVNGDGIDDMIIGADMAHPGGRERAGQVYVVFGTKAGFAANIELSALDGTDGFRLNGIESRDDVGWTVAGAGDVNGDGFDDVIMGAFRPDGWTGASYVVFGSDGRYPADLELSALDGTNGFRLRGVSPGDRTGWSVDGAGDVNGDGIDDVIVGASEADLDDKLNAGESYVVFGTRAGFAANLELASLDGSNGFTIEGANARDQSGRAVAGAGDVNGDGIDDLIVGAWNADPDGNSLAGASYVVFGDKSGFAARLDLSTLDGSNGFRLDGIQENDRSGWSVDGGGDFNGDGIDDLIVGAWSDTARTGATYVVFGSDKGFAASLDLSSLDDTNGFRVEGLAPGDATGFGSSWAGDINGDGFDDLVVGSWLATTQGQLHSGQSYIIFGHGTGDGSERLVGTPGADTITGLAGNDTILGRGGDDRLFGGAGNDSIVAGPGDDYAFGGTGNDRILGGAGNDELLGWTGRDVLAGGDGNDRLLGGAAADNLSGDAGNDALFGEDGNDRLSGGSGFDRLFGGAGQDTLGGGGGNDLLSGGAGADVFVFQKGGGTDHIVDFGLGADRIDVSAFGFASGGEVLALGDQTGSDVVFALGFGTRVVVEDHLLTDLGASDFLV